MIFSQITSVECEVLFVAALAHQSSALHELRALLQQPDVAEVSAKLMEIWLGLISFRRWLKQQQQTLVDASTEDSPPTSASHGDGDSTLHDVEQAEQQSETSNLAAVKDEESDQEQQNAEDAENYRQDRKRIR